MKIAWRQVIPALIMMALAFAIAIFVQKAAPYGRQPIEKSSWYGESANLILFEKKVCVQYVDSIAEDCYSLPPVVGTISSPLRGGKGEVISITRVAEKQFITEIILAQEVSY